MKNYSKDYNFIWDEIHIQIQHSDDWKLTNDHILEIVKYETKEIVENTNKEITNLEEKYYFDKRRVEPAIYLIATDN